MHTIQKDIATSLEANNNTETIISTTKHELDKTEEQYSSLNNIYSKSIIEYDNTKSNYLNDINTLNND